MSVHFNLTDLKMRGVSNMCDECLRKELAKLSGKDESAYRDALVAEIKRRKE